MKQCMENQVSYDVLYEEAHHIASEGPTLTA